MMTDMTTGSPAKMLIKFSLPMLLSVLFQQLYNIVDSVIAGQFIGSQALAAVGASYPVTMIFMAVATGCNIGCSVIISQLFGSKNYGALKCAASTSIISTLVLSAVLTGFGLYFCSPLMHLLNTPQNIFNDSKLYLNIYICGLIFLFMYNICTGVFVALGDSRTPLYFLIASSVGNIIMDIVFVVCFKMGVGGVAWATFICQGIASVLAIITLFARLNKLHAEKHRKFSFKMMFKIGKVAVPSILQQSFISVGNLFIQGRVNTFGPTVIAGYAAAIKLNTFAIMGFSTVGNALSSFTAQNIGAGLPQRVHRGFKSGLVMTAVVVLPFALLYTFFAPQMVGLFVSSADIKVINAGSVFLRIVSPFYIVVALKLLIDGVLRGGGAMLAFMVATFSDLILRVILAFVLSSYYGTAISIWASWPIGWVIATVLSVIFYACGVWKKHSLAN